MVFDNSASLSRVETMEGSMPRGEKSKHTSKQKRQASHIEEGYESRRVPKKESQARALGTVNKMSGGGKEPGGSGRGRAGSKSPARTGSKSSTRTAVERGGRASAARPSAARKASARKASPSKGAATRSRARSAGR
jgi:hypothetical protein